MNKKRSVELLKAEVQDAAHEWPVFHNVDVDEIVLEEEEVEVDGDLLKRHLKQECKVEHLPLLHLVPVFDLEEETLREVHLPNIAEVKPHLSILDDPCNLTANQKKQIADKSKGKLKAISEKEKMFAIASKKNYLNAHAGTFLMEGAKSTDGVAQFSNVAGTSVLSVAVQKLHLDLEKLPKEGGTKNGAPQPKRQETSVRIILCLNKKRYNSTKNS
jgi:hypothetical protein